jgi:hypothetical protein
MVDIVAVMVRSLPVDQQMMGVPMCGTGGMPVSAGGRYQNCRIAVAFTGSCLYRSGFKVQSSKFFYPNREP